MIVGPHFDICLRLFMALLLGSIIGLNRDINNKGTGLRTHAIVTLGSAVAVLSVTNTPNLEALNPDTVSRVIQGILTGIGFLGAGVIIKNDNGHVSGLTTAATVWISAVLGAACGSGHWTLIMTAFLFTILVLVFGGRVERIMEKILKSLD